MPPILYLIDGHALAYRTFFALTAAGGSDRFQTRSGEPTAGVYGFASVLLRILEQDHPEYVAVAFDTGKTFRDDIFPAYKATRAKMPDDLIIQIKRIRQMVDAFHFPRLEVEGFEADDVLGTIARQAVAQGFGVKIITGDRDLLQLVDERVIVNLSGMKLSDAKDYTPEDVIAHLGVRPDQVVDYKAMVGDTSDNIPGVAGIGEKTAVSLLQTYASLDDIYAHLEDLPNRVRTRLETGKDSAYLSRNLATIRTDVRLSLNLPDAHTDHINFQEVEDLFRQLEFRTLIGRLTNIAHPAETAPSGQQLSLFGSQVITTGEAPGYDLLTHIVNTPEELARLQERLASADQISLDTETTGTDPLRAELVGISLAVQEGEGYYIPVGHHTGDPQLPAGQIFDAIRPFLVDPHKQKVGHNLKYDITMLRECGMETAPLSFDSMLAEWLIDPASHKLGLKDMAEYYLDANMTHIQELIGRGKAQTTMDTIPVERVAPYAAADAEVVLRLIPLLQPKMDEQNCTRLFTDIEMPLIAVLAGMERAGIALDVPFFQQMSQQLNQRLFEIEQQVYTEVGYKFNLNSTQQLSRVLFETLKLEPPDRRKRTTSGHFSTSADVLEDMRGQHPVLDRLLEYRELAKLKSTYVDALPQEINPKTGRVHTSFSQTGSVTGRLASSEPNLQNIPARTELGRQVRHGFIADEGSVLLSVDYSQIELRIVASMSGDEAMLAAFRAGLDIHAATAAAIYNVPLDQVSKDMRRNAKSINFGLVYGMSAFGLSRYSGLTLGESENFVKAYFRQFPGVKHYLDGMRRMAAEQGYVETLLGRRRYFPNLRSQTNPNIRNREEREAINAPIQGTAADIMKIAMLRVPAALAQAGLSGTMLLQVHDELVVECPREELRETAQVVRKAMETAYPLSTPLLAEAKSGVYWGDQQPLINSEN
jgi:DNA polymerase I